MFDPKSFLDLNLLGSNSFLEPTFFLTKIVLDDIFVKLQFQLNSSVQVGQGVDFVFSPSQEQQQQQQQEPSPKSTRTKCTTDLEFGT